MDVHPSTHPPLETVQAYALGTLVAARVEVVARHLEGCPECRRRVAEAAPDTFLDRLRQTQARPEPTRSDEGIPPDGPRPDPERTDQRPDEAAGAAEPDPGEAVFSTRSLPSGRTGPRPERKDSEEPTIDPVTAGDIPMVSDDTQSSGEDGSTGDALSEGTRVGYFGDYELLQILGEGGMGIVYKARQLSLNRLVALKMFRAARFPSADEVRRFQNEAEAVARLDHPNIVPIFEVGRYEDQHYFSMKLIAGESLDKRLRDYVADPQRAARLVAVTAEAIHHAHQRGILHRDLKPANILVDTDRQPHVTDFGLAKRVEGDSGLTQTGVILGTPAYMAPEQVSARKNAVTTVTDVYGLGSILYALLTGRAPFGGVSVLEVLDKVRQLTPERPLSFNTRIPRDLEVICLKCLEKDPLRRYPSAAALAEDLDRYLSGKSISARAVGPVERAWLWVRRHPMATALLGTSLVALIAIFATVFFIAYNRELKRANRAIEESRVQLQSAYASEASARRQADAAKATAAEQRAIAVNALDEARRAIDLANAFLQAMQMTEEEFLAPRYMNFPADNFEFVKTIRRGQEIAARVQYAVEEASEPMLRGASAAAFAAKVRQQRGDFSLEPMLHGSNIARSRVISLNWQGQFDLVLGRLLAIRIRCYEYNWACARMKKDPPQFSNPRSNAWRLVPDETVQYSKNAAAAAIEAKLLLKRVIDEHPGTPWASLAQRELDKPFSFRWVETYVEPLVPAPRGAAEANRELRALLDLAADRAHHKLWDEVHSLLDRTDNPSAGTADAAMLWQRRGDLFALLGLWDRAADHYSEVVRLRPEDVLSAHRQILALLAAGHRDTALRAASRLLDRFRHTINAQVAADVAWSCVLAIGGASNPEDSVKLAETLLQYYTEDSGSCGRKKTIVGAHYRAGRFTEVIGHLVDDRRTGINQPEVWVFLAMAHYRLGHRDESLRCFDHLLNHQPYSNTSQVGLSWDDLEMRLLRTEAESVVFYDPVFPADPFAH